MKIPFATFEHMHAQIKGDVMHAFEKCYDTGWFIQGKEYEAFEKEGTVTKTVVDPVNRLWFGCK
jgi:dTDP-4-amino-4,6-dideoxygalactose transaminase